MSVPTSDSTDLERLQHKCIGALKELISVAMGSHLVRVTSIPHGPSPQFIDQYLPTLTTKPWAISTTACCTSGERKSEFRSHGFRFTELAYLQFIKCFWPGFGSCLCVLLSPLFYKGECNLSCCSTHQKRSWRRSSLGPPSAFALTPQ